MIRLAFVLALCATPLVAQVRFKTGVAAVRIDVLVSNRGRPVTGLTAKNFELRDSGIQQTVTDVTAETLPLNLITVLDVSGSVTGAPLTMLKDAVGALVEALEPADRAALVTFSERLTLHTKLTGDKALLRRVISAVQAGGATSFLDATFAGLALREADEGRTLLLLFSDARDTTSWLSARSVLAATRRSDIVLYPVTVPVAAAPLTQVFSVGDRFGQSRTVPTTVRDDAARGLLEEFADETGGRVFEAAREGDLRETFLQVLAEFRQRYVLSYTPTGVPPGGWHPVEVKLRGASGQVKARRGYFAATSEPAAKTPPK